MFSLRQLSAAMALLLMTGLVVANPQRASAVRLSDAQIDGYRIWLHSLEVTTAAQASGGQRTAESMFPFGLLDDPVAALADTFSLLLVAREMDELESRPRLLQESPQRTVLHALVRARNYRRIAEFDTALAWYDEAVRRDTTGTFADELLPESMAVAVAAGDSAAVAGRLAQVLAAGNPAAHAVSLRLAHRFCIAHRDTAALDRLAAALGPVANTLPHDLAYWHAFALCYRERWEPALATLLDLLQVAGQSLGLDERQRIWVLVAIPDLLTITGHASEAAPLYRAIAESDLEGAAGWARCQAAVLDFLAGRYLEAGTVFDQLCEQRDSNAWRAYACGMSQLSDEMERLRNQGREHGADAHYQR